MPFKPLKKKKRKIDNPIPLTFDRIQFFFNGNKLQLHDYPVFKSWDDFIECYRVNHDRIMEEWFSNKHNWGYRPWVWWVIEAPERRKKIGIEKWYDSKNWHFTFNYEDSVELLERLKLLEQFEIKELPLLKKPSIELRKALREMGHYFDLGELGPSIKVEEQFYIDETMDGWNREEGEQKINKD
jgi:hypothetical protein